MNNEFATRNEEKLHQYKPSIWKSRASIKTDQNRKEYSSVQQSRLKKISELVKNGLAEQDIPI